MKKIKFIAPLIGVTALTGAILPVVSCNKISTVKSFKIKTLPETYFDVGETFSTKGMVLEVTKLDGTTEEVSSGFTTNYDKHVFESTEIAESVEVVVTYEGFHESYNIQIASALHNFQVCPWAAVNKYVNKLENGEITDAEFCSHFTNGSEKITSMAEFLGLKRKEIINGVEHDIRVIGIKHDKIAGTSKFATFTFETATLLSDPSSKEAITSIFNESRSHDYVNSSLRKHLTGKGEGRPGIWNRNVFEMLNPELQASIKTVTKEAAVRRGTATTFTLENFDDTLFALTDSEVWNFESTFQAPKEGTIYEYWNIAQSYGDRAYIKKDIKGNACGWLLRSAETSTISTGSECVWGINDLGNRNQEYDTATEPAGISFAFCL